MTRLDALRSTVIDLERELLALGGDDGSGDGDNLGTRIGSNSNSCPSGTSGDGVGGDDGLRLLRPEIVQPLGPAVRSGEGNPNHADDGKFAGSPGGGHGKHWAKRQRRKRKLARLKRGYHTEIAAQKHEHRAQRSQMVKAQRGEREAMDHHYRKEGGRAKRQHAKELDRHDKAAHKEVSGMERRRERERVGETAQYAKGKITTEHMAKFEAAHLKDVASVREINDRTRKGFEEGHKDELEGIRHERKEAIGRMEAGHLGERKGLLKQQREERREKIEGMKGELADHGFRRKGAKGDTDVRRRVVSLDGIAGHAARIDPADHGFKRKGAKGEEGRSGSEFGVERDRRIVRGDHGFARRMQGDHGSHRFGHSRTAKASSAEAIIRHCLRRLGLWLPWKRGDVTDGQRLDVLAEIRDYGRAWYHHEASELFRVHGRTNGQAEDPLHGGAHALAIGVRQGLVAPSGAVDAAGGQGDFVASRDPEAAPFHAEGRGRTGDGRGIEGPGFDGTADGFPALPGCLPGGLHCDHGDDSGGMGSVHGGVDRALTGAIRSHVGRFFRRARQFAHELILAGAMALSGPGPLSDVELADVDRAAQEQAEYLQRFEREVIENPPVEMQPPMPQFAPIIVSPSPMTMSQFAARAELYGAAAWSAPLDVQRKTFIRHGQAVEERRVHVGSDTPCQMCRDEVAKGWSPIGTLLLIGQCTCLNQCHCHFDYRDSAGKITWSGRGRRKLRLKRLPPVAPAAVPPRPHVQVVPAESHQAEPPQTIIGPWLDKAGNPVVYHYEEAE